MSLIDQSFSFLFDLCFVRLSSLIGLILVVKRDCTKVVDHGALILSCVYSFWKVNFYEKLIYFKELHIDLILTPNELKIDEGATFGTIWPQLWNKSAPV